MSYDRAEAISRLKMGKSPGHDEILSHMTVGIDFLVDFWRDRYLKEYIPSGGSRIQFLTGRQGSGKSHFLEYFLTKADKYKTVHFSARQIWLNDFKEIFFETLRQCDIGDCLQRCADKLIRDMGYPVEEVRDAGRLTDYLAMQGMNDPFTKREIRLQLNELFLKNPLMDNNFAFACGLLTGGMLGHPLLEETGKEALLGWMGGQKDIKIPALRNLGLSPSRINKHNARHMLRSLVEIVKMAGYDGLVIAVDDLDIMVSRDSLEEIRYTKLKRDDVYESLRELIDEIDTLHNVFFLFAFDRKLLDDEVYGIKSYQALWFRIQNEVHSDRPNRFSGMANLDELPVYDLDTLMEMSRRIAEILHDTGEYELSPLDETTAGELLSQARTSEIALPRRVILSMLKGGYSHGL